MTNRAHNLTIAGATGAVGREMLAILEHRNHPSDALRLLASEKSAGSRLDFRGYQIEVQALDEESFAGAELALFSAGASVSRRFAPAAAAAGAVVIDNSSAFRMDPDVPLVIPEVNGEQVRRRASRSAESAAHAADLASGGADVGAPPDGTPRIIANPNCSTIILLMGVHPLRQEFGIDRLVVSTYQAASGAGAEAMQELRKQTGAVLEGKDPSPEIFPEPCAFNVFSHNSPVDEASGRNVEEQKVIEETRKIWNDPAVRLSVTCMRVPVMRAHAEAVNVTLNEPATEAEVREVLAAAPGVRIVDDRAGNEFPTSLKASGIDDVLVGRIRPDESQERVTRGGGAAYRGFDLFVCGDQLRKGAALNALQIADLIWD